MYVRDQCISIMKLLFIGMYVTRELRIKEIEVDWDILINET